MGLQGRWLPVLAIFVFLLFSLFGAFFIFRGDGERKETQKQPASKEVLNWQTYENKKYGYKLKFPKNFRIFAKDKAELNEAITGFEEEVLLRLDKPKLDFIISHLSFEGTVFKKVRSVDELFSDLPRRDNKGNVIRREVRDFVAGGEKIVVSEIYEFDPIFDGNYWKIEAYFEHRRIFFEVQTSGFSDRRLFEQILETLEFF